MYTHSHTHAHTHARTHTNTHITHIHTNKNTHTHTHTHTLTHTHSHTLRDDMPDQIDPASKFKFELTRLSMDRLNVSEIRHISRSSTNILVQGVSNALAKRCSCTANVAYI